MEYTDVYKLSFLKYLYIIIFYVLIIFFNKKMVKKSNPIETTIKLLLQNHVRSIEISRQLHINKQRVNYLVKTLTKEVQFRKKN